MTRAFWDSQFRFSAILPDFAERLEQMAQDSALLPTAQLSRAAYGRDPRQWVEWLPGTGSAAVLPVILHGGYWRALRAEDHRLLMPAFRAQGGHVANLEYRLMPEHRLGDLVADVIAGLTLLGETFPRAQLLPIGHSAGAHLALSAVEDPEIAARTCGVIALSGLYDLAPVTLSFLQDELSLTEAEVAAYSLAPAPDRPPLLLVNGDAETHEFRRAGALMASKGRSALKVLPESNHMSLIWSAMAKADDLIETVLQLEGTVT